jgi:hypothetical protein
MSRNSRLFQFSRYLGPGAFDPGIALALISSSAIMQVLLAPESIKVNGFFSVAIVALVGHLAMFLTFLLFGKLLKPRLSRGSINFSWVIGIGLVLGLERAAVGWATSQVIGNWLGFLSFSGARVFNSITSAIIVAFAVTILGTARQRFLESRKDLLALKVLEKSDMRIVPDEVQEFVDNTRIKISKLPKESRWGDIRAILNQIISNELRPLSHKLWEIEDKKLQKFSLKSIFLRGNNDYFYRPHFVVPIWFLTSTPIYINEFGLFVGLEVGVIRAALLLAVLVLARQIKATSTSLQLAKLVLTVLVFTLLQALVGRSLLDLENQDIQPRFVIAGLLWITQLIILVGMSWALFESGAKVRSQLAQVGGEISLEPSTAAGAEILRSRKLARHLHGQVRNRLHSLIAGVEPDENTINDDLLSRIDLVLQSAIEPFEVAIASRMELEESLFAQWGAFIDVNFEFLPAEISLTDQTWALVAGVAEEGVANAVRHGFASSVKISIVYSDSDLFISIRDDGTGPRQGLPGIGTAFFSAVSNDWVLKDTGSGAKLRLVLPIS